MFHVIQFIMLRMNNTQQDVGECVSQPHCYGRKYLDHSPFVLPTISLEIQNTLTPIITEAENHSGLVPGIT